MGCGGGKLINKVDVDMSHFDVQRCIGRGGFGKVHAVVKLSHPHKDEWYACKALEKAHICKTNMFGEVARELAFLKTLHHPLICNGHYAFQDGNHLYLVLDLAMGGDMRVHIKEKQQTNTFFKEAEIKYWAASLISALDFCHSLLILHRDIKPGERTSGRTTSCVVT